jgi:hypothetical protein
VAVIIQIRRDTDANWSSANPILAQGEIGENLDNQLIKIGDGVTAWSSLSYYGTTASGITSHSSLADLDLDDHPQYLLANGYRPLSGDWNAGGFGIIAGSYFGNGSTLSGIAYVDGDDVYFYDETRGKDLGVSVIQIGCGRNSVNTTTQYLRTFNGTPMNLTGIALPYDATLIGITMSGASNSQSWTAQIGRNDVATVMASLSIVNVYENHTWSEDVDFDEGDRIQVRMVGTNISHPQVRLFFRRRK